MSLDGDAAAAKERCAAADESGSRPREMERGRVRTNAQLEHAGRHVGPLCQARNRISARLLALQERSVLITAVKRYQLRDGVQRCAALQYWSTHLSFPELFILFFIFLFKMMKRNFVFTAGEAFQ